MPGVSCVAAALFAASSASGVSASAPTSPLKVLQQHMRNSGAISHSVWVEAMRTPTTADILSYWNSTCIAPSKRAFKSLVAPTRDPHNPKEPAAAVATFSDMTSEVGMNFLNLAASEQVDDASKAYGAGYLEGYLTAEVTYQSIINSGSNLKWTWQLERWLSNNTQFVVNNTVNEQLDSYWTSQKWVILQLLGIYDGFCDAAPAAGVDLLPFQNFMSQQLTGDFDDLTSAISGAGFQPGRRLADDVNPHLPAEVQAAVSTRRSLDAKARAGSNARGPEAGHRFKRMSGDWGRGHCSALILATEDGQELYTSQTSWSGFEDMVRIYKFIDMPLTDPATGKIIPGRWASFSSYPGTLFSGDDWYQLSSGLVVMETTIGNNNQTLYNLYVQPNTIMDWQRNIVANRMAVTGKDWTDLFSLYNSGTYNNEFMVVDYKQFAPSKPGTPLQPGLLWVLDQAPGYIVAEDLTVLLDRTQGGPGFFGSYNVPAFPLIFNLTGNQPLLAQYGDWFSWHKTARAQIFARDAPKVHDLEGMLRIMRYNDFQHDPVSTQGCEGRYPPYSAENAIAARDDLNPANGTYFISELGHRDHAAIDCKVTTYSRMAEIAAAAKNGTARVVEVGTLLQAGPSYDQQPVFSWSTTTPDIQALSHLGQPDVWAMPWMDVSAPATSM